MCSILSLHLGASSNPPREVKKLTQSHAASDSQILSYTAGLLFPCLFLLAMALTGPLLIMYRNVYGGGAVITKQTREVWEGKTKKQETTCPLSNHQSLLSGNFRLLFGSLS